MLTPRLIGVFGGTFDPVHYGHIKPAQQALQAAALSEVRFIPSNQPVHRSAPYASPRQRLEMLALAVSDYPGFIVDDREIHRGGLSYTFDTLTELRSEQPDATLCLLIGFDALLGFMQWHRWRHILELAHLVVMVREGYDISACSDIAQLLQRHQLSTTDELHNQPAGGILLLTNAATDISSTYIRSQLSGGKSIKGLVPPLLEQWLYSHSIYSTQCSVELL